MAVFWLLLSSFHIEDGVCIVQEKRKKIGRVFALLDESSDF